MHTVQHQGSAVRYIEVEAADVAVANRLAYEILGRTLEKWRSSTRRLLRHVGRAAVGDKPSWP